MTSSSARELNWTIWTILLSSLVSVLGLLIALALQKAGVWPQWDYCEFVFGGLCGATAVHRLHPGRPVLVLLVFIPVMSAMLLVGSVLFHIYVLGELLEF